MQYLAVIVLVSTAAVCYGSLVEPRAQSPPLGMILPTIARSLQARAIPQNSPLHLQPFTYDPQYNTMMYPKKYFQDYRGRPNQEFSLFTFDNGNVNNQVETLEDSVENNNAQNEVFTKRQMYYSPFIYPKKYYQEYKARPNQGLPMSNFDNNFSGAGKYRTPHAFFNDKMFKPPQTFN